MIIYILAEDPYHDLDRNSSILGVYESEEEGLAEMIARCDPTDINADDYRLTEWDVETNKELRQWDLCGRLRIENQKRVGKDFYLYLNGTEVRRVDK